VTRTPNTFDTTSLLRPELAELKAYVPVPGQFDVRLDANEAPALLSAAARARLAEVAGAVVWERYPDATIGSLRDAIAARCSVTSDQVLVGVGSDEIITLLLTALAKPKGHEPTILTTTPSFVMYRMSARVRGQRVVEVPLDHHWDLNEDAMLRAIDLAEPSLLFIASPNNPTSTMADPGRLARIIEGAGKALVVVDEAYVDYSNRNQLELLERYENVAVLRTLSKIGFAALRVGWLLGRPALVRELDKARLPYNIPTPSQALARVALTELHEEIAATCRAVVAERERVALALGALEGVRVAPSQANFLWFETDRDAAPLYDGLAQRGVLIRSFHNRGGRLAHCLRVTIGTREENDRFLETFRACLASLG
jgi:histidinol-phosphate aminotransferase